MAALIEDIRTRLLASSDVATLIGTRLYALVMPESSAVPALVLSVISDVPNLSIDGTYASRAREARVQVDAYAKSYREARALAEAAAAVFGNLGEPDISAAPENAGTDLYDNEAQLYRVTADYSVYR